MASPTTAAAALTTASAVAKAALPLTTTATTPFIPRQTFDASPSTVRTWFLGHHHAALARMRQHLGYVDLIIECRDFRIPLTSWNPLLERTLLTTVDRTRRHMIVYTHRDLGPPLASATLAALRAAHTTPSDVHFVGLTAGGPALHAAIARVASDAASLTGLHAMVVGMPNAGKSTLLNQLRNEGFRGLGRAKAARTGAEPGVTRKMETPVCVAPRGGTASAEGVFLVDTPGVFMPYVARAEDMLKLALVGCVKEGLVAAETLVDYLLFHMNRDEEAREYYARVFMKRAGPTNDVGEFLATVARRTGKLKRGGEPNVEAAAAWVVREWRKGMLGRFLLDEVNEETLKLAREAAEKPELSLNQAKKKEKEERKVKNAMKRQGIEPSAAAAEE